jgi:hypothetical protein
MTFEVVADAGHPEIQNDGMKYSGLRFRAECKLAGKVYTQPFGVDAAFGDPTVGEPDTVLGEDVPAFAGIPPPRLRLYPSRRTSRRSSTLSRCHAGVPIHA